ncbi:MAG: ParA family protein [Alphaproteobacteria bacterium]|nr:ParA family protein [Alphaproteobacteria bacterium]
MTLNRNKVIAIVNQKGGVAKTTTAVNLATSFAAIDQKTLVIDFDSQGNASTGFGIDAIYRKQKNIYKVITGLTSIKDAIIPTSVPKLDIIPATVDLSAAEIDLIDFPEREFILKKCLNEIINDYDRIIIDCPPSLGISTINALAACESVIIPLQCEFYALEGLAHLLKTVEKVKKRINPNLEILGLLLIMYDKRNRLTDEVEKDVRSCLNEKVFKVVIPRNVKISEAPSHGIPALIYDHRSSGSRAYALLAREILQNEKSLEKAMEFEYEE